MKNSINANPDFFNYSCFSFPFVSFFSKYKQRKKFKEPYSLKMNRRRSTKNRDQNYSFKRDFHARWNGDSTKRLLTRRLYYGKKL